MTSFSVLRVKFVNNKSVPQFCRACACKLRNSPCEIENNSEKPELPLLVKRYVPEFDVKVANACLCTDCVSILYSFHIFKRKCLRVEEDLRLHIRKHPEIKTVDLSEVFAPEEQGNIVTEAAQKLFSCKICEGEFRTKGLLNYHTQDCHGGERFQCNQCRKIFVSKTVYDVHLESHKTPSSVENLRLHIHKHPEESENTVTNATETAVEVFPRPDSEEYLRLHKHKHPKEPGNTNATEAAVKAFSCKVCEGAFLTKRLLAQHIKRCRAGDQKPYKCKVCPTTFTNKLMLLRHMPVHNKAAYKYKCTLCTYGTNVMSLLNKHLNITHRMKANCRICNRSYITEEALKRHIKHHHHQRYQCTECSRTFGVKNAYETHLAYHRRPDASRYICKICNFVFHTGNSAVRHLTLKHNSLGVLN